MRESLVVNLQNGDSQQRRSSALKPYRSRTDGKQWGCIMVGNADSEYGANQIVLVADAGEVQQALRASVEGAGHRVKASLSTFAALEWFRSGRPADLILLSLDVLDTHTKPLLLEVNAAATQQRIPIIACCPVELVDTLYAYLDPDWTTLLCTPGTIDLIAALSVATRTKVLTLSDVTGDMDTQRLRRLADEVSRIARTLAALSAPPQPPGGYAASLVSDFQSSFRHEPSSAQLNEDLPPPEEIRRMLRLRRLRDSFFDGSLFADPAWDILLDLAAARQELAQVAVSSLCIAASVPPTTALRWIKAMTDHGLLERVADPEDGRRIFIQLSDSAVSALSRYFQAAQKVGGGAI